MKKSRSSWGRFICSEDGTATIEFVLTFPLIVAIFCASFESSFFMVRSVGLERSIDLVIRDLRLGALGSITHSNLKKAICERSAVLGNLADCTKGLKIELQPVSTANFIMPTAPVACVDRNANIDPLIEPTPAEYVLGGGNQIMLMRVCLQADPMFPTTVFGVRMNITGPDGGYSIVSTSTFVNEPRT